MLSISNSKIILYKLELIISSLDGSMTMFDQVDDENSSKKFKNLITELPYIGGF